MTEDLEGRIPRHPPRPIDHTTEARLNTIENLLNLIVRALGAEQLRSPGMPAGILQRQDHAESQLADHEERLIIIEEAAVKTREKTEDWLRAAFWDIAKLAGAAGLGAWIGKGGH